MDETYLEERYEHAGCTVEIWRDTNYPSDDALDMARVATIVIEHRAYALGDEQRLPEFERECEACEGGVQRVVKPIPLTLDITDNLATYHDVARLMLTVTDRPLTADEIESVTCGECGGTAAIPESPVEFYRRTEGARVVIPIHVREDWQPSLSLGKANEDEEGADGYAFDTPEAVKEIMGDDTTDADIERVMRLDLEIYSDAMHGDVFGFIVKDPDGETVEDGSVWGFVGQDLSYVKSEAEAVARENEQDRKAERQEAYEWACRDTVTR